MNTKRTKEAEKKKSKIKKKKKNLIDIHYLGQLITHC